MQGKGYMKKLLKSRINAFESINRLSNSYLTLKNICANGLVNLDIGTNRYDMQARSLVEICKIQNGMNSVAWQEPYEED